MGRVRPDADDDGRSWLDSAYEAHGGEIYSYSCRVTGDPRLAEEITQDVFVRAWRARQQFDGRLASLRTWLFRIARNAAIDARRARNVRPAPTGERQQGEGSDTFDADLAPELRGVGGELCEVAEWLNLADPAELTVEPPPDMLERVHEALGPRPAVASRRLAPMWVGRWTPAVAAAVLLVAVLAAALWPRDDGFVEFELASQGGQELTAELRFEQAGESTVFDVRVTGLVDLTYDVWVWTEGDLERHWLGRFTGDIEGTETYTAEFAIDEIERFWVTDPADEPVLGHDID